MIKRSKHIKKAALAFAILAVVGGGVLWHRHINGQPKIIAPTEVTYDKPQTKPSNQNLNTGSFPSSLLVKVPFTSQAPTANWDELHNEACEEASAIMVQAYFNNITSLPPEYVEREITKLTQWQDQNYGYHLSINTQEAAHMIEEVYGLKTDIVDMSEKTVKQALLDNKLIIWAGNGRLIGNPNFRAPGPIYHMLVIKGWNQDGLITNDPGTRKGNNYQYSYHILYTAAGNYDHDSHETDPAKKQIIIVSQ